MQRSRSVSSVPTPENHHRVVIRPDPKFKFNPEDEDEDSDNEENSSDVFASRPQNDLGGRLRPQPQHSLRSRLSLQHPPLPSRGRLGSLSNLSAVSEAPLTACAVSSTPQPQEPRQPRRLYHSPYGTIREEHEVRMRNTNNDHSYRIG